MEHSHATYGHRTVPIVDDNEDQRLILRTVLLHAGYQVEEAADGGSGVALALRGSVDLVIIDPCSSSVQRTRRATG